MPERNRHTSWLGIAAILGALLGWSSIPLYLKHFSHLIDPWTSNGWRYGASALFWLPVLVLGLARRDLPRGLWKAAVVPSIANCIAQVCFVLAPYYIDPGLMTFGLRSNIVFVTLGAALLFPPERRIISTRGFIAGVSMVVLGTAGTILLGQGLPRGATLAGVLLALAAGATYAAYALAVRRWMHGVNAVQSFAVISLYTAIGMVALMVALGERHGLAALSLVGVPVPLVSGGSLPLVDEFTWLMISALIGIALGHVAYYYAINSLGLAASSGVVQLQPFFVSLASLALFDERLTSPQWASGSVAVVGAAIILLVQHRLSHTPPAAPDPLEFAQLPPDPIAAIASSECEPPDATPTAQSSSTSP